MLKGYLYLIHISSTGNECWFFNSGKGKDLRNNDMFRHNGPDDISFDGWDEFGGRYSSRKYGPNELSSCGNELD
jgi:hypothetical protein